MVNSSTPCDSYYTSLKGVEEFEVNAKLKFLIKAKKHGYKIKNYCLKMIFRVNFAPDKQNA